MDLPQFPAERGVSDKYYWISTALYGRGSTMARTFRYPSSHGFISLALVRPFYESLRLLHDYAFAGTAVLSFNLFPFPMRLRLDGNRLVCSVALAQGVQVPFFASDIASWRRVRWITIGILIGSWMILWLALLSIGGAMITLPEKIINTAFRCWSTTLTSAFRSVPILIAALVIIFTTGDAWRLYGSESTARFEILTLIIFAFAIAAMIMAVMQLRGGWRQVADSAGASPVELAELARKTPARDLVIQGVVPVEVASAWYAGPVQRNVRFMFWFTLVANIISVALITFIVFVFIGMVAVSAGATKSLLQSNSIDILWTWKLLGQSFVMTRALLLLSILFGCVAALTFATASLQDDRSLSRFMQFGLRSHRRSLSALAYYLGSIAAIQEQLSWQAVYTELRANNRMAILDVLQMAVASSPTRIMLAIFDMARIRNFKGWAGSQGLTILEAMSDHKLARISAEIRDFVLASAASNPAMMPIIESVRHRVERISSDAP